jgi:transcriptional regulator with XRE-family HTH domain
MMRQLPMAYPCRLRAYRKSSGLSQRELAALLGLRSQGLIAEYETGKKHPGIKALIACALIFDRPIRMIFPRLHSSVALEIRARAQRLQASTSSRRRPRASAKLSKLITRANPDN